jgi:hypothetical protein
MAGLYELFGARSGEVWDRFSEQIGGRFSEAGWGSGDVVRANVGQWAVTLDAYMASTTAGAEHTGAYTRLRAAYVNADGFQFTIYRARAFSPLGRLLRLQDITVGHPRFDRDFVIKGNDEAKVRQLFADAHMRDLLSAQPTVHLQVKDDEGWFRDDYPDGVDELYFRAPGIIDDIDRLHALYNLFGVTLNHLCHMDAAYEDDAELAG